ncbi:hypothetical protein ES288_D05G276500v1 [Gossypium darwinii]|uniref:Uncharacterized protein n=2 Tax=Gossypium TaxID=3633 RepID=A0A5D2L164_GOSTO|nr:hypothetical protein ES288_D05G276500v1 [Gossypium darwinii]TYH72742.1 hypothetical protein ES332_D05G276100v1 [Gossypium tomentosum]
MNPSKSVIRLGSLSHLFCNHHVPYCRRGILHPKDDRIQVCSTKPFLVNFLNYRSRISFNLHCGKPRLFGKKKPLKASNSFCHECI